MHDRSPLPVATAACHGLKRSSSTATFPGDLARANERVGVHSPFIAAGSLGLLEPHLKALVERRVRVYVITRALDDRGKRVTVHVGDGEWDRGRPVAWLHEERLMAAMAPSCIATRSPTTRSR